jgi:hypothetical protein
VKVELFEEIELDYQERWPMRCATWGKYCARCHTVSPKNTMNPSRCLQIHKQNSVKITSRSRRR